MTNINTQPTTTEEGPFPAANNNNGVVVDGNMDGTSSTDVRARKSISDHLKSMRMVTNDIVQEIDDNNDSSDNGDDNGDGQPGGGRSGETTKPKQPKMTAYDLMMKDREKKRLRTFRLLVVGMLVMTAAVTGSAYYLLGQEENKNFEDDFWVLLKNSACVNLGQPNVSMCRD